MQIANRSKDRNKAEFIRKVMERFSKPGNLFDLTIPANWSMRDVIEVLEANNVKVFTKNANTIHTYTKPIIVLPNGATKTDDPDPLEIPEVW